jgi:hypothetical protein
LELPRPLETEDSPDGSWRDLELQSGNRVVFRRYLCVDLGGIDECLRACAHCRRWSIRAETSEYKAKIRVPCSLTFSRKDTAALANPSQFLRAKRWSSGGSSKAARRRLVALGFPDPFIAADHVPAVLAFKPIGLEGFDDLLGEFMLRKNLVVDDIKLLPEGKGFLLCEFGA